MKKAIKKAIGIIAVCALLIMNLSTNIIADDQTGERINDNIVDVNGEIFTIERPDPKALSKVNANAMFGLSSENKDNYEALQKAFDYCRKHPNTYLEIDKGVYYFRTEKDLNLDDLNNILMDGNGSEFVFSTPKYFKINRCNSLEIRELSVEWDWDSSRLASLVKISKCNKVARTIEIEFTELDDVCVDIPIICFMQFDKDNLIPGSYGGYKTFYPDQVVNGIIKKEKVAPNRIKLYFGQESYMNSFHDEEVYLIRHYTYGGRVFQPMNSEHITFDDIHIYSAAGMGYIIGDKTKYFQIINSSIGRRTDRADAPYISTTADGIHILNTGGYFRIENCDFSFTGDDIINIHDDVMYFTQNENGTVFKGKVTGGFAGPGDKVKFKNIQMGPFEGCEDYEVEVDTFYRNAQTNDGTVTFKTPVDSAIGKEGFLYRSSMSTSNYVIRNNYIHETKGRAMLVLGSNALVEDNIIYRTVSEGIHVLADIDSKGIGSQGVGVDNVIIRGNVLTECTVSGKKPVVMVSYKNGDTKSEYTKVLTNITLENNKFIGCYVDAIEVDNTTNLTLKDNLIQDSGKILIGDCCEKVTDTGNTVVTTTHVDTHTVIRISGRAPSCVSYGMKPIEYCMDCHRKLTGVIGIKPLEHKPGRTVVEKKVEATCDKCGSYEEVIYCTECGNELVRETKVISATGHDFSKEDGTCVKCGLKEYDVQGQLKFTDVTPGTWQYDTVRFVYARGILTGTGPTTFSPNTNMTRAQFMVVLWRLEGQQKVEFKNPYIDVKETTFGAMAMQWAKNKGLAAGYSDGTFRPNEKMTREQFITFMYRYARFKGADVSTHGTTYTKCKDADRVDPVFATQIQWAYERGFVAATGEIIPKNNITRIQAAAIIERFLRYYHWD